MPERPQVNIRLSEETKSAIEAWASEEKRSVSNLLCYIIEKALENREAREE